MIHYCEQCDYKSAHKWSVRRHMQSKHKLIARKNGNDHSAPSQTGSGAEQTGPSHSQNKKHANLQEESIDQYFHTIDLHFPLVGLNASHSVNEMDLFAPLVQQCQILFEMVQSDH